MDFLSFPGDRSSSSSGGVGGLMGRSAQAVPLGGAPSGAGVLLQSSSSSPSFFGMSSPSVVQKWAPDSPSRTKLRSEYQVRRRSRPRYHHHGGNQPPPLVVCPACSHGSPELRCRTSVDIVAFCLACGWFVGLQLRLRSSPGKRRMSTDSTGSSSSLESSSSSYKRSSSPLATPLRRSVAGRRQPGTGGRCRRMLP